MKYIALVRQEVIGFDSKGSYGTGQSEYLEFTGDSHDAALNSAQKYCDMNNKDCIHPNRLQVTAVFPKTW